MAKRTKLELVTKSRRKNPPRTAFKPGQPNPYAFEKGVSGNPGGKPKEHKLLSKCIRAQLNTRAPKPVCEALGLPVTSSWAQCIAVSLMQSAVNGNLDAMILILESREGKIGVGPYSGVVDELQGERPAFEVHFIESDGDGHPRRYTSAEAMFEAEEQRKLDSLTTKTGEPQNQTSS